MPDLSAIKFNSLYCLFKGEPGTRKSTQALSFPLPQFWISWDHKMDSLVLPMRNWKINPKEVDFEDYSDWDAPRYKLESFLPRCKYRTIVVDTITSGSDYMVRQTRKFKGAGGKNIGTIPVAGFEEYNAEASALGELIALTKELNKMHEVNIILIAHVIQKEMKSQDGQTHMSRMLVTAGKTIAQKIPAYCSEVYHFNIKPGVIEGQGGKYALKTTHTGDDFARTSLPLQEEIVFHNDPLYEKWILPAVNKINQTQPQPLPFPTLGEKNASSSILEKGPTAG